MKDIELPGGYEPPPIVPTFLLCFSSFGKGVAAATALASASISSALTGDPTCPDGLRIIEIRMGEEEKELEDDEETEPESGQEPSGQNWQKEQETGVQDGEEETSCDPPGDTGHDSPPRESKPGEQPNEPSIKSGTTPDGKYTYICFLPGTVKGRHSVFKAFFSGLENEVAKSIVSDFERLSESLADQKEPTVGGLVRIFLVGETSDPLFSTGLVPLAINLGTRLAELNQTPVIIPVAKLPPRDSSDDDKATAFAFLKEMHPRLSNANSDRAFSTCYLIDGYIDGVKLPDEEIHALVGSFVASTFRTELGRIRLDQRDARAPAFASMGACIAQMPLWQIVNQEGYKKVGQAILGKYLKDRSELEPAEVGLAREAAENFKRQNKLSADSVFNAVIEARGEDKPLIDKMDVDRDRVYAKHGKPSDNIREMVPEMAHWPERIASYGEFLMAVRLGLYVKELDENVEDKRKEIESDFKARLDEMVEFESPLAKTWYYFESAEQDFVAEKSAAELEYSRAVGEMRDLDALRERLATVIENFPEPRAIIARYTLLALLVFGLSELIIRLVARTGWRPLGSSSWMLRVAVQVILLAVVFGLGLIRNQMEQKKLVAALEEYIAAVEFNYRQSLIVYCWKRVIGLCFDWRTMLDRERVAVFGEDGACDNAERDCLWKKARKAQKGLAAQVNLPNSRSIFKSIPDMAGVSIRDFGYRIIGKTLDDDLIAMLATGPFVKWRELGSEKPIIHKVRSFILLGFQYLLQLNAEEVLTGQLSDSELENKVSSLFAGALPALWLGELSGQVLTSKWFLVPDRPNSRIMQVASCQQLINQLAAAVISTGRLSQISAVAITEGFDSWQIGGIAAWKRAYEELPDQKRRGLHAIDEYASLPDPSVRDDETGG